MITVVKKDLTTEPYQENKVLTSIIRAKIPASIQPKVVSHITSKLYDGISTDEIYHHITEYLDTSPHPYAKSRYSLKDAIMSLGPTGYPFEDFIARLLQENGYTTRVRQILMGKCISHEIDVLATRDNKTIMVEAKFHNRAGVKSEVHVALYTNARFHDIKNIHNLEEAWLITNTKTTIDANSYAQCSNMRVMSWNYPEGSSLRDLIERSSMHPITILSTLSQANRLFLLNKHVVLCKDLQADKSIIDQLPLTRDEKERLLQELSHISDS